MKSGKNVYISPENKDGWGKPTPVTPSFQMNQSGLFILFNVRNYSVLSATNQTYEIISNSGAVEYLSIIDVVTISLIVSCRQQQE